MATTAAGLALAGALLAIDQVTKAVARDDLSLTERIPLVGDLLGLQLAYNAGASFSIGEGATEVVTVASALGVLALLIGAVRVRQPVWVVAIAFALGGGAGNLIDRLTAEPGFGRGRVTDFLAYGELFIGNIADIWLGVGVGLALLVLLRGRTRESDDGSPEQADQESGRRRRNDSR